MTEMQALAEVETPAAETEKPAVVWVGRFAGSSGYASATRNAFQLLQKAGIPVIGVDINNLNVFGDIGDDVNVFRHRDNIDIRCERRRTLHAILHDTPDRWSQIEADGLVSLTGYVVTEIENLPVDWQHNLNLPHRLWTASDFNRDIFARYTKVTIDKVYHFVDQAAIAQSADHMRLDELCNPFRVLHVVSNFNRKDTAAAIKAYVRAFAGADDTTLVIKLPARAKAQDIQKFLYDAVHPEVDLADPALPHILLVKANLSNEEMWSLYSNVDVCLSTERAKGFDLISAEAMAVGCPAVSIGWSANTEFMTPDNSYLLPAKDKLVPIDPSLIEANHLYDVGEWASFSIDEAASSLREVRERPEAAQARARKGRETIADLLGQDNVVRQMLDSFADREPWETVNFKAPRLRVWRKGRDRVGEVGKIRQIRYWELSNEERALFERKPGESPIDYIEKRRPLWGKYGCVMPPLNERTRMGELKDRYLGQSIFVMGNGPSLRNVDFDDLIGVPTFSANRISLAFDKTDWRPTFFTALDWLVTPDNYEEYNAITESIRLFPMRFHGLLEESEKTYWYESTNQGLHLDSRFQTDATQPIRGAGTVVTAMLQLAWHMGFRRFYLLGCDANYSIPKTVKQSGGDRFGTGTQLHLQSTVDDDPNHFDPRYFGANKMWHDPNVDEMKRGFRSSQLFIESRGGMLRDCTEGGKLDFIPKVPLADALHAVRKEAGSA